MMKKPIQKRSADDLLNYPLKKIVRGWFFRVDELINWCKEDIEEMLGDAFTK
jgi:hypothetical protein